MKKLLSLLLAFIFVFAAPLEANAAWDLESHYAKAQMENFISSGFISGYPDGSIRPDNPISRAEFYSIVNRAFRYTQTAAINFADVKQSDWFYQDISKAMAAGYIITGSEAQPNKNITREEVAVIITHITGLTPFEPGAQVFTDVGNTWTRSYIGAIANAGIMRGYTDNTFKPYNTITRAEAVVTLMGAFNKNSGKQLSYVPPVESSIVPTGTASQQQASTAESTGNAPVEATNQEYAYTITGSSYGSSRDDDDILGDVLLDNSNCSIKNIDIKGNLVLSSKVNGTVTLTNVYVSGSIYIYGNPKLTLDSSEAKEILVNSTRNDTRITMRKTSVADRVRLYTPASLYETSLSGANYGFSDVVLEPEMTKSSTTTLSGDFDNVDVHSSRINVVLTSGTIDSFNISAQGERNSYDFRNQTTVNYLYINGRYSEFIGSGRIKNADVNARGTIFRNKPDTVFGDTADYSSSNGGYDGNYLLNIYVVDKNSTPFENADVYVYYSGSSKSVADSGTTDVDGLFYTWLDNGTYTVEVRKSGYSNQDRSVQISDYDETITIKLGTQSQGSVNITVVENVSGSFNPLSGVMVYLTNSQGDTVASKLSATDGTVSFANIAEGSYTVRAEKTGYTDKTLSVSVSSSGAGSITLELVVK